MCPDNLLWWFLQPIGRDDTFMGFNQNQSISEPARSSRVHSASKISLTSSSASPQSISMYYISVIYIFVTLWSVVLIFLFCHFAVLDEDHGLDDAFDDPVSEVICFGIVYFLFLLVVFTSLS